MSLSLGKQSSEYLTVANLYKGEVLADHIFTQYKPSSHIQYVTEDQFEDLEEEDPREQKLTKIRLNDKNENFFPQVEDYDGKDQVDRLYLAGVPGCHKSTFIRAYVVAWLRKYPRHKIWLFSSKSSDSALDDLPIERVTLDDDICENQMDLSELAVTTPSLCIFDDIQDFPSGRVTKEVGRLRDQILRTGRSKGIFCVYVHHDPCAYKETKDQLFLATKVIIFPKTNGRGLYDYLMSKHLHLKKKTMEMINNLRSNYVCVNKLPACIISDKYILLE